MQNAPLFKRNWSTDSELPFNREEGRKRERKREKKRERERVRRGIGEIGEREVGKRGGRGKKEGEGRGGNLQQQKRMLA